MQGTNIKPTKFSYGLVSLWAEIKYRVAVSGAQAAPAGSQSHGCTSGGHYRCGQWTASQVMYTGELLSTLIGNTCT